jgi:hypothetical protein
MNSFAGTFRPIRLSSLRPVFVLQTKEPRQPAGLESCGHFAMKRTPVEVDREQGPLPLKVYTSPAVPRLDKNYELITDMPMFLGKRGRCETPCSMWVPKPMHIRYPIYRTASTGMATNQRNAGNTLNTQILCARTPVRTVSCKGGAEPLQSSPFPPSADRRRGRGPRRRGGPGGGWEGSLPDLATPGPMPHLMPFAFAICEKK